MNTNGPAIAAVYADLKTGVAGGTRCSQRVAEASGRSRLVLVLPSAHGHRLEDKPIHLTENPCYPRNPWLEFPFPKN
jgi:hypothetical protein